MLEYSLIAQVELHSAIEGNVCFRTFHVFGVPRNMPQSGYLRNVSEISLRVIIANVAAK